MVGADPDEQLSFIRADAVPGVEILSAVRSRQSWHVFHERYDICACRSAHADYTYRGRRTRFVDRSVAMLEPGEVHANLSVDKPADFKVLLIQPEAFLASAEQLGVRSPHFRVAPSEDPVLFTAFDRFSAAVDEDAPTLEQQSRFAECMRLILATAEKPPPRPLPGGDPEALRRARAYIVDRYSENVALSELEGVARMSRFHLLRAFSRRYGMPPHAFQLHVRVERATALLRQGWLPVDVAAAVGFADQSHLNRHFKRVWGVTPGRYARLPERKSK